MQGSALYKYIIIYVHIYCSFRVPNNDYFPGLGLRVPFYFINFLICPMFLSESVIIITITRYLYFCTSRSGSSINKIQHEIREREK